MKKKLKLSHKTQPSDISNVILNKFSREHSDMNNILSIMEKLLYWAAIIESSDDAIISKSMDGYITSWNKGARRLYGYTQEEVIGKSVSILMPPEREDDFPYILQQLKEGKRVEHYETKRKTKDGRIIDVSITVSPIRDVNGNIIGASKIARDITERVENEKRRAAFVSAASHELKTPITSQKAFGDLLERLIEKNGDIQYKPYIQKINNQTRKLTRLIEDLLEISQLQSGRLRMEEKPFNFDELVSEIVESTQMITRHKINQNGKSKKFVKGDREHVGQVLSNLLTNAIKYSPQADKVNVTTKATDEMVTVIVQDFGIGIEKKYHTKIFEQFFRVIDDDKQTYPGMGIGLHLSSEIARLHGGKIWVESEKNKGSRFYFTLPISHE